MNAFAKYYYSFLKQENTQENGYLFYRLSLKYNEVSTNCMPIVYEIFVIFSRMLWFYSFIYLIFYLVQSVYGSSCVLTNMHHRQTLSSDHPEILVQHHYRRHLQNKAVTKQHLGMARLANDQRGLLFSRAWMGREH